MKSRTTKKYIRNAFEYVIAVPYCNLQTLLLCEDPVFYTARAEGWGADVYSVGFYGADGNLIDAAIATGYDPFGNVSPSYELCRHFEVKAQEIVDNTAVYAELCATLEALRNEFVLAAIDERQNKKVQKRTRKS